MVLATDNRLFKRLATKRIPARISWTENGRQAMHWSCWEGLNKPLVRKNGTSNSMMMSPSETRLLNAAKKTLERFDSIGNIQALAERAASLTHAEGARQLVAFTGAGISAAAGIPAYRGTDGLDTKTKLGHSGSVDGSCGEDEWTYRDVRPTSTHLGLARLEGDGWLACIATQNCDDLHARAGSKRSNLLELHGNVFVEYCVECQTEHVRNYEVDEYSTDCYEESWYVRCKYCKFGHYTGRVCNKTLRDPVSLAKEGACTGRKEVCNGKLRDTIINFGDPLRASILEKAVCSFNQASVCLAMGSSMTVSPANELPLLPSYLVVVNPQVTGLDDHATIRVFGGSDEFMIFFVKELEKRKLECSRNMGDAMKEPARPIITRDEALSNLNDCLRYSKETESLIFESRNDEGEAGRKCKF